METNPRFYESIGLDMDTSPEAPTPYLLQLLDRNPTAAEESDYIAELIDAQDFIDEQREKDPDFVHPGLHEHAWGARAQELLYQDDEETEREADLMSTRQLAKRLQVSLNHLHNLRVDGVFEPGTHWVLKGKSLKSGILWSYAAVWEKLTELATEALMAETHATQAKGGK
jgi:hypothetical protein